MTAAQFNSARNGTLGVSVTGTLTDGTVLYDTISVAKVQTGSNGTAGTAGTNGTNGTNGADGTRTAFLYMYKWSATTPTTFPSGTSTYTWAGGTYGAPGTTNGWSSAIGTPTGAQILWRVTATFTDSLVTATSTVTWPGSPTPEQYTPQIGDVAALNTITTAFIQANAVTNLTAAYSAGTTIFTTQYNTWIQVQSVTFTSGGGPNLITMSMDAIAPLGSANYELRILKNGSVIWTMSGTRTGWNQIYGSTLAQIIDTPSAGSVTYSCEAYMSTNSYNLGLNNIALSVLETKR